MVSVIAQNELYYPKWPLWLNLMQFCVAFKYCSSEPCGQQRSGSQDAALITLIILRCDFPAILKFQT